MNKKVVIAILVGLMLILGGSAIYIAVKLNNEASVTPQQAQAATATCSGGCGSGKECNNNPDPDPGKMWSCVAKKCVQTKTNDWGGYPGCFLDNSCVWQADCGCDEGACNTACKAKLTGGTTHATATMTCTNCGQKFSCECSKSLTNTPTVPVTTTVITKTATPTPTRTPTNTPTITNTVTPTTTVTITVTKPITTIPQTALITDEVDRLLIGISMIFIGILFYKNNLYYSAFFFIKNAFVSNPKKKNVDQFEKKVQKKYKEDSD